MMGRRRLGGRDFWIKISEQFKVMHSSCRPFCTNNKPTANQNDNGSNKVNDGSLSHYDAYRDLDKLDFMTAAKILFTTPPKQKKFGLDFHLVQLFFVCMPSLAVYLVAQYARREMKRMDAELEQRKQAEEAKAKEMESKAAEEKAATPDPQILEVKVRLDKLEETIKEIVDETKKQSSSTISDDKDHEKQQPASPDKNAAKQPNEIIGGLGQQEVPVASVKGQKAPEGGGLSQDEKK